MKANKSRREREQAKKQRYWERHIQDWRASGLSQAAYQRQHNLPKWQFVYWKKKIERSLSDEVSLVPISLPVAKSDAGAPLCLVVNGQYRIEISGGFQEDVLEQVLRVVNRL